MTSTRLILLLLISTVAVDAVAKKRQKRATGGVFTTFLVPIANFSELLTGPLAGVVQSLPIFGPILAPNGTILGFSFGGIIISVSEVLDTALAPLLGAVSGVANGIGGGSTTGATEGPVLVTTTVPPASG